MTDTLPAIDAAAPDIDAAWLANLLTTLPDSAQPYLPAWVLVPLLDLPDLADLYMLFAKHLPQVEGFGQARAQGWMVLLTEQQAILACEHLPGGVRYRAAIKQIFLGWRMDNLSQRLLAAGSKDWDAIKAEQAMIDRELVELAMETSAGRC